MTCDWHIQAVPPASQDELMRFLAGGGGGGAAVQLRAHSLAIFCHEPPLRTWASWARHDGLCLGAACVAERVGHTGLLIVPPLSGPRVVHQAQAQAMRQAVSQAILAGLSLVQWFARPDDQASCELAQQAGLEMLAELIYMRLDCPPQLPPDWPVEGLTWRGCDQISQEDLARLIESTYARSLDCPLLAGRRRMEDVILSHRASGTYRPRSWWVADLAGQPAGCILVNASTVELRCADVVYAGVAEPFRGRGLCRAMLRRAQREAWRDRLLAMTLAVDARNGYARRIYDAEGFVRTDRRLTFAALSGRGF